MRKLIGALALAALLAGCGALKAQKAPPPDERAGRSLVIYYSHKDNTRKVAKGIAQKTGGDLFDIAGKKPLPSLLAYDIFFVGAPAVKGHIAVVMREFLAQTDFIDGTVIPFWTNQHDGEDLQEEFESLLRGARVIQGGAFCYLAGVKTKDINQMTAEWAENRLTEQGARKAAGERAEDVMKAFAAAYSRRFGSAVFRNGDWVMEMDGVSYYYAQGRFLREEDADNPENFRSQSIYRYSPERPDDASGDNRLYALTQHIIPRRRRPGYSSWGRPLSNPDAVRSAFYETIWQARTREEAYSRQQWVDFLESTVQVHQDIVEPLGRVERRIQELTKNDEEVQAWRKSIRNVSGWNWRNIAGSESRSFHAYGVAVDLQAAPQPGMETYWQWTAAKGIDWHSVPADKRLNPPIPVIRAFEEQGFAWGGKWYLYDTMHFEYRPEILMLGFQ
ncbi:MAG: M15 family metallopeptidase [Treponema sp.]|jgi:flavodoxin|nr:M15 family metallopeptidase [Treponema sp.]